MKKIIVAGLAGFGACVLLGCAVICGLVNEGTELTFELK